LLVLHFDRCKALVIEGEDSVKDFYWGQREGLSSWWLWTFSEMVNQICVIKASTLHKLLKVYRAFILKTHHISLLYDWLSIFHRNQVFFPWFLLLKLILQIINNLSNLFSIQFLLYLGDHGYIKEFLPYFHCLLMYLLLSSFEKFFKMRSYMRFKIWMNIIEILVFYGK